MSGRLLPAAVLCCALALAAVATAAPAGGGERADAAERRAVTGSVAAPRQPIGAATDHTAAGGLRLSRTKLLAGRPGQRLAVRYRMRRAAGGARLRVVLRRIRRDDPRHPGQALGGETESRTRATVRGRRLSARLRGLNPEPGPHRVILKRAGSGKRGRLATVRIEVLPQSRTPVATREPAAAPEGEVQGERRRRSLGSGDVNHDLSFRPGSEASSAIALETDDPLRGIAATDDDDAAPVAFVSSKGFASGSVRERPLPASTALPAGGGTVTSSYCCDPTVAADAAGNLWMAAATDGGAGRIVINRVAPGETAFRTTSTGLPIAGGSSDQKKPSIALLDGAVIAAVWIETAASVQNVVYSECDISSDAADCDDPDNWSPPVPVTSGSGLYSMPALGFSPDGDAYAVWWDAGSGAGKNAIEIDRCEGAAPESEDCAAAAGASWDEESKVADLDAFDDDGVGGPDPLPLFCPIIGAPGGLVNPSPGVEVGPAGNIFVTYSDLRDNADPGSPSRCTASGSDKTFDSYVAAGAVGAFPAANTGVRLSADGPLDLNDHFLPSLSVDPSDGEVEAAFYSTADDPGGQRATREHVASADLGLSYSAPAEISDGDSRLAGTLSDGIDYGDRQGADSAAGTFRPAWTDAGATHSRDPDLYVLSSQVTTTIDSAPTGTVAENTGAVAFSTEAVRTECSIINVAGFAKCGSPYSVGPLKNATYTVQVRATDLAGNVMDVTPAAATWTIADLDPPETTLTKKPPKKSKKKKPKFAFSADEENSTFQCRYDKKEWLNCKSPQKKKVSVGKHKFRVRAVDLTGNVDPKPEKFKFKRERKCKKKRRRAGRC